MLTMLHELRADKILDANVSKADTRFRKNSDLQCYKFTKSEKQHDKVLSQRKSHSTMTENRLSLYTKLARVILCKIWRLHFINNRY
jgi:hypothetical protein